MPGTPNSNDKPNTIDVNPQEILERIDGWVDGFMVLLPNLVVALLLIIIAITLGKITGGFVYKRMKKKSREDLGRLLQGLLKWSIYFVGFMFAATIVMPSLKPGEMVAGLGIGSVAIGFAFKDILQNWLAGLLILLRQPFEVSDQIEINGYEGTVERIQTRSTLIRTYDGQRAVIPNSEIYTNSIIVKTAHEKRRSQYDIGVGYGDDLEKARDIIIDTLRSIPEIEKEPAPQALPWDLAASWVTIRARWWTDSRRTDIVQVRSKVIIAIKKALDDEKIDMPYDTQVHLFHDQTEDHDGDRSQQREGWPADNDEGTKPRWKAEKEVTYSESSA